MSTYAEAVEQLEALAAKTEKRIEEGVPLCPRERLGVRAYPIEKRPRLQLYALPAPEAVQ